MKVSIVLPNLNGAGWLQGSIDSLYAQTEQDFELIVVDNGSSDQSLDIAKSYESRPGYTLIQNKENLGFAPAVNQGIKAAKAPFVLLFNNDAFAAPTMLEEMLKCMQQNERCFSVQCLMLQHWHPTSVDDAGDFVTLFGWAFRRGDSFPAAKYMRTQRVFSCCGGAALYRKSAFDEIGLFEECFFAYLEDVDIGWRANSLGWQNIYCPVATCTHIGGATTGGAKGARYNDFKSIQSGRNSLLLPYKNMPILMLLLNLPFLFIGYAIKTVVFHLRGFGAPWRKGMREGFALLSSMKKPKFRLKHLPNYIWVEGSLIVSIFRFIAWRIGRIFIKQTP